MYPLENSSPQKFNPWNIATTKNCTFTVAAVFLELLSLSFQAVLNGYNNKFRRADKDLRLAVMCNCFAVAEFVVVLIIILLAIAVYTLQQLQIIDVF